jgi:tetratricopeptide (TPR) repeat protein
MKKILIILLVFTTLLVAKNTISQKTFKQLKDAQKLSESKHYKEALMILNPIIKTSKNKQEKLYAYQSIANIYINKNEYDKVANAYIKIINLDILKNANLDNIKLNLSQIYLSDAFYKKSLKYSFEILDSKHVKKLSIHKNIALAYYYDEKYKESSPYIKKVIKTIDKKESWYRMLYSSYIQVKDYKQAIKTLKYMTTHYSKNETYWMQMVSIYQTLHKNNKVLASLELAYDNNFIHKKDNILYYVNILLQNNLYNKAEEVMKISLKKEILKKNKKNFDILISSTLNAKNYKDAIFELNHSTFANTSKYKLILGNIYYNNEQYTKAIKTLKNYKFKKHSKADGKRYILMALSSYELNNKKAATKYLKKASLNSHEKRRVKNIANSLGISI